MDGFPYPDIAGRVSFCAVEGKEVDRVGIADLDVDVVVFRHLIHDVRAYESEVDLAGLESHGRVAYAVDQYDLVEETYVSPVIVELLESYVLARRLEGLDDVRAGRVDLETEVLAGLAAELFLVIGLVDYRKSVGILIKGPEAEILIGEVPLEVVVVYYLDLRELRDV